jgi:hypothetical protein
MEEQNFPSFKEFTMSNYKFRLLNYCYLRGFKHGIIISDNLGRQTIGNVFSFSADVCPCLFSKSAHDEFVNGFNDGYSLGIKDKLQNEKFKKRQGPEETNE